MNKQNYNTFKELKDIIEETQKIAKESIIPFLKSKSLKISTAESLTSGKVQNIFGQVSGASSVFAGGSTAYNINMKVKLFGVDYEHALSCNCVSEQVATEMSKGALSLYMSDFSIATTGYAEAYPEENIKMPKAFYAITLKKDGRLITHTGLVESSSISEISENYFKSTGVKITPREAFQHLVTYAAIKELEKLLLKIGFIVQ